MSVDLSVEYRATLDHYSGRDISVYVSANLRRSVCWCFAQKSTVWGFENSFCCCVNPGQPGTINLLDFCRGSMRVIPLHCPGKPLN